MTTFKHRQRVAIRSMGSDFKWRFLELGTVIATKKEAAINALLPAGYWLVRFDDGGALRINEQSLRAVDVPPRGREARRRWVGEQAEALGVPAFATPR